MKSVFCDKEVKPDEGDLKAALGDLYNTWREIEVFTKSANPVATCEWNFSSAKYGWSFRISDKKRVLVYLLPRDKFFKAALVFGQKATDEILASDVAESIKNEIREAKVYAEGRGIRIEVRDNAIADDIKKLIRIKNCALILIVVSLATE